MSNRPPRTTATLGASKVELRRDLGLWQMAAMAVGAMIGAGILATPGQVAHGLGSPGLVMLVWSIGGAFAMLGALCYAELASALPRAGGFYVYAGRAFGDAAGFTTGWIDCLQFVTGTAFLAAFAGSLAAELVPALGPSARGAGIAVIVVLSLWHSIGTRASGALQTLLSGAKYVAVFGVVVIAMLAPAGAVIATVGAKTAAAPGLAAGIALALQAVVFAYDGWYIAIYLAEEVRNPGRTMVRAAMLGVGMVIALYLLINFAYLRAMPIDEMARSSLVAADIARARLGDVGATVMTATSFLTVFGTIAVCLIAGPRVAFAMARNRELPRAIALVNGGGTPYGALALIAGLAAGLLATVGTPDLLLAISSYILVVLYSTGFVGLWWLRRTEPDLERPYRMWGYPWSLLVLILGVVCLLAGFWIGDPRSSAYATALIALSFPIYALARRTILRPGVPVGESDRIVAADGRTA